jgi:large subunit ribosomal protein L28
MSKVCSICGKGPIAGISIARRGLPKKKGGIGLKTTGVTKRRFLPNIQTVKAVQDGTVRRIKVCAKCLKAGKVVKA